VKLTLDEDSKRLASVLFEPIEDDASRVRGLVVHPKTRRFLEANARFVSSTITGKPLPLKPDKPWDTNMSSRVIRAVRRCADELNGKRTVRSLATGAQLERAYQFSTILAKRKDNKILLPDEPEALTHGEIGRWLADARTILIKEGRWDNERKCEVPKKSRGRGK